MEIVQEQENIGLPRMSMEAYLLLGVGAGFAADGILGGMVDDFPALGKSVGGGETAAPHWDDFINLVLGWSVATAGYLAKKPRVEYLGLGWAIYSTAFPLQRLYRRSGLEGPIPQTYFAP